MDVDDLAVFLSLCETENTRDTAAEQRTGQPNVSRALGRLELDLGIRLFSRRGRRLELNRHGRLFRGHVERALTELDAGRRAITADTNPDTGLVRLGFLQSTARDLVPALLRRYRLQVPGARFALRQGLAGDLYDGLAHDHLDVLVVTGSPGGRVPTHAAARPAGAAGTVGDVKAVEDHGTAPDPSVSFRPLLQQQLCLAVPQDHRLARAASGSLGDLADESFIALSPGADLRRVTDRLLADAGVVIRPAFESMEIDTVAGLIAAGLGVGVLPSPTDPAPHGPAYVPVDPPTTRVIGLAWNAESTNAASVRRFVDHVAPDVFRLQ